MANRITMRTAREILSCMFEKRLSQRQAASLVGIDRTVVSRILNLFDEAKLNWPLPDNVTDDELESIFYPPVNRTTAVKSEIDFGKIHVAMQFKGATLVTLHNEWVEEAPDQNKMGYHQFCRLYRNYLRRARISMRRMDEFGEFCYVDYSGMQPSYFDPLTMKKVDCQLFVGVLGGSKYTYCEATHTQRMDDWLASHIRMFAFFSGAPRFVVPDNLKSGVTKADRFFPLINESYKRLCEHYGAMVFPARSRTPKDKPAAEGGVLLAQRWILFRLRNQTFFSLLDLNKAISTLLIQLNEKKFQKLPGSRFSHWLEHEQAALQSLPETPYKLAKWGRVRAGADYVIKVDGSFYSVPHQLRNTEVDYCLTDDAIEIIQNNAPVATHRRSSQNGAVCILPIHQPPNHRAVASWSEEDALTWAQEIGPAVANLLKIQLDMSRNNLVAYRTTEGLKSLSKTYGPERIEEVCAYAVSNKIYTMRLIREILSKKLDRLLQAESKISPVELQDHKNIRGSSHYKNLIMNSERSEETETIAEAGESENNE